MTDASLQDRATELTGRLAGLRSSRAIATLENRPFDSAPIAAAEAELTALTDAEGEQVRRERAAAADAHTAERARIMLAIAEEEATRIRDVAAFEKACAESKAQYDAIMASAARQRALWKQLSDRVPDHTSAHALAARLDLWDRDAGVWAMKPPASLADAERYEGERSIADTIQRNARD